MTDVKIKISGSERGVALALLASSIDPDDKRGKDWDKVKSTARLQEAFQAPWFERYEQLQLAHLEHGREILGLKEEAVEDRDDFPNDRRRDIQDKQRDAIRASKSEIQIVTVREDDASFLRDAVSKYGGRLPPGLSRDLMKLYDNVDEAIASSKREVEKTNGKEVSA